MLYPTLLQSVEKALAAADAVQTDRQPLLNRLAVYMQQRLSAEQTINLVFICTHNSRRSHLAQAWAKALGDYFAIPKLSCFSGGTEATALHPNAVTALHTAGFAISSEYQTLNPVYRLHTGSSGQELLLYSKKFDAPENPSEAFAAIMVCSDADEACPFVPGTDLRLALPYEDPKIADGTPEVAAVYSQRSALIASELAFVFRQLRFN